MKTSLLRANLSLTIALPALFVFAGVQPAAAQQAGGAEASQEVLEEIIVTGSRIRRSAADSIAPITFISGDTFPERGYVSASEALNDATSISPELALAPGSGSSD